ncbi:hypothetical protein Fmac_030591 [Flemingia macrophylla]|uniref:Pectinesterase inhibitor domain-containing protein n=1 Tax=Flemingia macrophylla TaxID=520843 RepID=A0ABD1L0X7_9FABA
MISSTSYFLCLTLSLILISRFPLPTNARTHAHHRLLADGYDLINQICKEMSENENECTNILGKDPKILCAENFVELSKAILEIALNKGIEGQNFLEELAETTHAPAIVECANSHYDMVIRSFRNALNELKDGSMAGSYEAKIVSDGSESCERVLAAANTANLLISYLNHQISLLSFAASLAINKVVN